MERLLYAMILAVCALGACKSLKINISAFNVKIFGPTKFSKSDVVGVLKQIVRRYDIILIQEIRDKSETIIHDFTNIINNDSDSDSCDDGVYDVVVSERLGRTRSKEQYAFLYRRAVVEVVEVYQHNDTEDVFEREPFTVQFRTIATGEVFFLMGIHIKPADAIKELEALSPTFDITSQFYNSTRGVIMGDFNAGCRYLSRSRYEELSLVRDPLFIWLLGYDVDTTVASSSCAYDRFIVHTSLNSSVMEGSAGVFNYTEAYSLSAFLTANVSDHYPIEFQLQFNSTKALCALGASKSLKISAFNVEIFGPTKFSKCDVVGVLKQIVCRYDIILIQEIRDISETIIHDFTNIINNDSDSDSGDDGVYGVVVSERLGRTRSKEQYAFLYRRAVVEVVKVYQHNDTEDVFEREPFSVQFRTIATGEVFFLMGIHIKPADVIKELEALSLTFDITSQFYNSTRGVIMGDFNAGCRYLSRSRYEELSLVRDPLFIWLLGYDVDTTVASSSCAYDRFIVHTSLNSSVMEGSAGVFNYTEAYSLSPFLTANVSDHYPIEFQLQFNSTKALCALGASKSLKISAFNVEIFGPTKFSKSDVVGVLKQIVRRYDIILIQEIRDKSETIIHDFTNIINNVCSDSDSDSGDDGVYDVVVSERLGRTRSKEQYAFLYRRAVVEVVKVYQHNDTEDVFEREPFSVQFRTIATGEVFFLMGIHIKPSNAIQELEALSSTFDLTSQFYNSTRGVIMGDFNAGCRYLSRSRYEELSLVRDPLFIWLLGYDVDTTVASSSCAYDRFIVHASLNSSVMEGSAGVFNYTEAYSLSAFQTASVSDHYPIEFQLQFNSMKGMSSGMSSGSSSLYMQEEQCSPDVPH